VGFGLLHAQILLLLIFPIILVYHCVWRGEHSSVGLWVLTGLTPREKSFTCGQEFVVRIDAHENWHLSSRQISPEEMPGLLTERLGQRKNCVVYLVVDPGVPYGVPVQAIDSINSTRAKAVVLVTSANKKLPGGEK
jgi:hypothetical protein